MEGATPQIKDPTSKMKMAKSITSLEGKIWFHCEYIKLNPRSVRKKPEASHDNWSSASNSAVIFGMAVARMS